MMDPLAAGRAMLAIAALGVVASLVGTVVAVQVIGDLDDGVDQSLEVTAAVLATVDESFVVADDALAILDEGLADAETAVRALAASMAEGQAALASVTDLTGGDLADALEQVEQALPAVQAAATAIDRTLALLGSLPIAPSYSPDRTLGESIGELRGGLDGIPDQLRKQADQAERTTDELEAATAGTLATAESLGELRGRLAAAGGLLEDYARRTGDARELVTAQQEELASGARRAQWLAVGLGIVFALGQFVPAYLGLSLIRGAEVGAPLPPG